MVERRSPKPQVVSSRLTAPESGLCADSKCAVGEAVKSLDFKYSGDNMGKIVQFVKESYAELRKVIWPGRDDVISSVKVVIVSTIIIAAVLGLVDVLLLLGVQMIF